MVKMVLRVTKDLSDIKVPKERLALTAAKEHRENLVLLVQRETLAPRVPREILAQKEDRASLVPRDKLETKDLPEMTAPLESLETRDLRELKDQMVPMEMTVLMEPMEPRERKVISLETPSRENLVTRGLKENLAMLEHKVLLVTKGLREKLVTMV